MTTRRPDPALTLASTAWSHASVSSCGAAPAISTVTATFTLTAVPTATPHSPAASPRAVASGIHSSPKSVSADSSTTWIWW
ncbi:hypothetical protein [Glycomyces paridis]|uniref:hypothetical protein n=1 Tax=Glycomyces paridis TaxID=2126555 RepID=UPI0013051FBF|nr:hypothetical protein [Glycomyces paridis]